MFKLALPILILPLTLVFGTVLAQDRAPAERQTLSELAYTLGESHALRQLCMGLTDQYWRNRMLRLTEIEESDAGFDAAIRERFNTGYAAGQAQAQDCDGYSRRAEAASAARGQALAQKLSTVMRRVGPPPVEPLTDP
jgi:uncharacterized protein (TIGR02301 family)